MEQTVLVKAYVHERPEGSDVGHNAGENHSFPEVINRMHILVESELGGLLARVQSRFAQFSKYVIDGWKSFALSYIVLCYKFVAKLRIAYQLRTPDAKV